MKRYLPFLLIALVAAGTIVAGLFLYRAKVAELTPVAQPSTTETKPAETSAETRDAHVRGPATARVTLEEFGDFQCPPCATVAGYMPRLKEEFPVDLRVVFRNYPLAGHNHALEAARAAEAAGFQEKFWEMHDLLYKNQSAWSKEADVKPSFMSYAQELGLDLARFEKDYDGPEARARVSADQARGNSLGVKSTPTMFLNGQALAPPQMAEPTLRAAIAAAVRGEAVPKVEWPPKSAATPAAPPPPLPISSPTPATP